MKDLEISFNPKQNHLNDIKNWMVEEKKRPITENGNWTSIVSAYRKKRLIVAIHENKAVGFYALRYDQSTLIIEVAEMKPNYRRRGVGKLLLEKIIEKYVDEDIFALQLFCEPKSSHLAWKEIGFKYFPDSPTDTESGRIEMYKIIKPHLSCQSGNLNSTEEVIEIWDNEPEYTKDKSPTWVWALEYLKNSNILKKPIVHFGNPEWRMRWRKGANIYRDCRYENFDKKNEESYCMIIKETPKL